MRVSEPSRGVHLVGKSPRIGNRVFRSKSRRVKRQVSISLWESSALHQPIWHIASVYQAQTCRGLWGFDSAWSPTMKMVYLLPAYLCFHSSQSCVSDEFLDLPSFPVMILIPREKLQSQLTLINVQGGSPYSQEWAIYRSVLDEPNRGCSLQVCSDLTIFLL